KYAKFDFRVMKTEHFDIYFYPAEEDGAKLTVRETAARHGWSRGTDTVTQCHVRARNVARPHVDCVTLHVAGDFTHNHTLLIMRYERRQSIDVFRAISDPTRRALLDPLRVTDRSVNELAEPFQMTQPAISQHLRVLRLAGLVRPRQVGRQRVYK